MTALEYFDGLRDRVLEIAKREQTLEQLRVATQPHGQRLGSIGHSGNKDSTAAIDRVILAAEDLDRLRTETDAELERATQVLYGIDNSSLCYIVSEKSDELAREIISGHVHRGVTILEGEGAYSHQTKHVIMCVIKRTQIGEMRRLVKQVDERAFFIVTDAKNVFGNGFENISEVR